MSIPKIHLTMPLALGALAVWLALSMGGRWLESAGYALPGAAVTGRIGLAWALAALFALALLLASSERREAGLCAPQPWKTVWLVSPPLLYALLMLVLAWAGGWPQPRVLLIVACNAALVAVSEELMFRAILLKGMLDRYPVWPAVLISSALFGLAHTANGLASGDVSGALWQAVAATLQGVGYAAIRLRTRSIWPMVLVHGLWDYALVTATLPHPAEDGASILPYIALLAVLPLCLYGVYLLRPSQRAAMSQLQR
ncbi:CPBP family intramembrane glutamic endopeptidase [Janthinobacterium sp. GB1R12]|uniref:CPBP family intramembrane glutamic endopeptidase n=1 Tax=Janthinobacterium sp. GB1R12 TaxID=3424190 RepID=UPI003F20E523